MKSVEPVTIVAAESRSGAPPIGRPIPWLVRFVLLSVIAAAAVTAAYGLFLSWHAAQDDRVIRGAIQRMHGDCGGTNLQPRWLQSLARRPWVKTLIPKSSLTAWRELWQRTGSVRFYRDPLPDKTPAGVARYVDQGTLHATRFRHLERLSLIELDVAESTLARIATIQTLEHVDFSGSNVNGSGLAELASLPKLTRLDLEGTQISDDGLMHVGRCANLRWLSLAGSNVTDEGLVELESLKNLASLDLNDTAVTAEGLKSLASLPNLQIVDLKNIPITKEVIDAVRHLPAVKIMKSPNGPLDRETLDALKSVRNLALCDP